MYSGSSDKGSASPNHVLGGSNTASQDPRMTNTGANSTNNKTTMAQIEAQMPSSIKEETEPQHEDVLPT